MLGDTQHDAELESLLLCGCWGWEMLLLAADEQNNKIIVLSSRGGASVISTSGNASQCAGLHHMHTAPGHTSAIHS